MNATKTASLGISAAVAGAAATCHIVQGAVLGMLGGLGFLPFVNEYRSVVVFAIFGCATLALYSVVRIWRRRRESPA
jgi:hypothetical protein